MHASFRSFAQARDRHKSVRIEEISCWENIDAGRSSGHLHNKMIFLLLLAT